MNKEKALDLIHRLDRGMDKLQATRDCWQSELVYDLMLCCDSALAGQDKGGQMLELKPCPFCGSNAKVWKLKHRSKQLANFCVAEWQFDYEVICTNNRCNARNVRTETEEAAIKAWNRRTNENQTE